MSKFFSWIFKNKIRVILILLLVGGGGYYVKQKWFTTATTTRYVTGQVERGVLTTAISGTGQVSVSNQVEIKSKASGDVTYVGVKVGQEVKTGTILLQLNARDALKTLRDAEDSLLTAQLSLEKLKAPADALTAMQSENSLIQAKESKQTAEDSLKKDYEDGFNTVSNAFLELPALMTGLHDMIYNYDLSSSMSNVDWYLNQGAGYDSANAPKITRYRDTVITSYTVALNSYNTNYDNYKLASRVSSDAEIEALILETYNTTKLIADTVKNTNNLIDFVQDAMKRSAYTVTIPATMTAHQTNLDTYTGKTNTQLSNLLASTQSIKDAKDSIVSSDRTIAEKTASLAELKAGADPLDIRSQEITIKQRESALQDAREKLSDYTVRAPFDGVIAKLGVTKGDTLSAGTSVGTLITKQKLASIALNEIDAAKVKVGQKVAITFDAIDGLNITGEVAEIDTLGTVTQGVVSYNVKIVFDVQDDRVKSGMSLSASIILASKPDVLLAPNSAIKTQGNESYVEILVNGVPEKKNVTVGESNDLQSEITSGLVEGEEIITQKVTVGATTATPAAGGAMGGNAFRALR
jgi:RND family efflux transporter MFP subunit